MISLFRKRNSRKETGKTGKAARNWIGTLLGLAMAVLTASTSFASIDNFGNEFWLTIPENLYHETIEIHVVGEEATNVTVEVPGVAFSQTLPVTPGAVTSFSLPTSVVPTGSNVIENKGIHVIASKEVAVYGFNNATATRDAYIGLPLEALDVEYMVLAWSGGVSPSQMNVVAPFDNTTVTITPTVSSGGGARPAGVPFQIILNEGQVYQLRADSTSTDLTGTTVVADQPVSVFGGDQCGNIPTSGVTFCDMIVEQLPPLSRLGSEFVVAPLPHVNNSVIRVLAPYAGTDVVINGSTVATLNSGQFYQQQINSADAPLHILTSNDALVAQYLTGIAIAGDGDPAMMMVPPTDAYVPLRSTFLTLSGFNNYVSIFVPTGSTGAVNLDGSPLGGVWTPVGSSGISTRSVNISPGSHTLDTGGTANFRALVYGFTNSDSYAYPSGGIGYEAALGVSIASPVPNPTQTGPVDFLITYSGASSVNLNDTYVTVHSTGTANATTVTVLNGTTFQPTVRLSGITGTGTLSITVAGGAATDGFGTDPGAGPSEPVSIQPAGQGTLGNFVFRDVNSDNIQNGGEPGIDGVTVNLLNAAGDTQLDTTTTSGGGFYAFTAAPGNYIVEFELPSGATGFSLQDSGGNDSLDSDPDPVFGLTFGQTGIVTIVADTFNDTVDAGIVIPPGPGSIGNFVWNDLNGNGAQDGGEPGIDGVTVNLLNAAGDTQLDTTVTAGGGLYSFTTAAGNYIVEFVAPSGAAFSPQDAAADTIDSDANTGTGRTGTVIVQADTANNNVDCGFVPPPGPVGDIVDVTPDPRNTAVASIDVTFSVDVQNVTLDDFTLNGTDVSTLSGTGLTVNAADSYTITGLALYTSVQGPYQLIIVGANDIEDLSNNALTNTPSDSWAVDLTAPAAPVVSSISDDTGNSATDEITNDQTLFIHGTAEADSTVEVYLDASSIGTTVADGSGNWTFDYTGTTMPEGSYVFTADATDLAGNTGPLSAGLPVVIDTTPPEEACGGELALVGPAVTSLPTANFAALFTEPVYNVTPAVFGISGPGTVTDASPLSPPDTSVTVEVTSTGPGLPTLIWGNPSLVLDVAGNAFTDANGSTADVEFVDISAPQDGNRIAGSDNVLNDRFGQSLALDGETLFVGAPSDDDAAPNGGVVFVLERDSTSSFTEAQKLTADDPANDDRFGESVAVSGNWAVIGAPYKDNPGADSGKAYSFWRDSVGVWYIFSGLTPSSNGTYYRFGHSVAISGRTIAVSSPLGQNLTVPGGGVYRSGIVTIFEYDSCADTWNETQVLQASDATSNDNFGHSIAMAGNRLLVGAPLDDDNGNSTGSVYVFTRLAGVWTETQKLNHTLPGRFDYFGQSVSISPDGSLAVIGAPGRDNLGALNSGAAYVFERTGLAWSQTDELVASDATNYDAFGQSVGVSTGGIAVGSWKDDTEQLDAGSGYLFTGAAGSFSELSKVLPLSGDQGRNDNMGTSVTVFGETAVIGSPFGNDQTLGVPGSVNVGSGYIYRLDQIGP